MTPVSDRPGDLLALARDAGRAAAAHVRAARSAGRVDVTATKSSPTDVVTVIDRSCEDLIRERILAARPADGFVGEEGDAVPGTSGVEWVVDPIDGTVNFVYGLPRYAVAIAARHAGTDVAGFVVNIATDEAFEAVAGGGARRYGPDGTVTELTGPPAVPVAEFLVATGFNYTPAVRAHQGEAVARMLPRVRDVRRLGAAALDFTDLAAGRLDAYVEQGLKPWDIAAGGLIAREAGLVVTGLTGEPDERLVVAARADRVEAFLDLVRACRF